MQSTGKRRSFSAHRFWLGALLMVLAIGAVTLWRGSSHSVSSVSEMGMHGLEGTWLRMGADCANGKSYRENPYLSSTVEVLEIVGQQMARNLLHFENRSSGHCRMRVNFDLVANRPSEFSLSRRSIDYQVRGNASCETQRHRERALPQKLNAALSVSGGVLSLSPSVRNDGGRCANPRFRYVRVASVENFHADKDRETPLERGLQASLRANPQSVAQRIRLSWVYLHRFEVESAEAEIDQALGLEPNNAAALELKSHLVSWRGKNTGYVKHEIADYLRMSGFAKSLSVEFDSMGSNGANT